MSKLTLSIFALSAIFTISSCSYKDESEGSSTPIDTTNVTGKAPAEYGADTTYPVYEGQHDTTLKANTASSADSIEKAR